MGAIFNELCKGPVLVVDDGINNDKDKIKDIIEKLKKSNLPCMTFESPGDVIAVIPNLLFSNFVILDWNFWEAESDEGEPIVQPEGFQKEMEETTAELIKSMKNVVLAPVFILTKEAIETVWSRLNELGISKEEYDFLFVENKETILADDDTLINTFEEWVISSPHIYLSKWWTTELLVKNNSVFWELYDSVANWPAWFYKSFEKDGEEPKFAIIDCLFKLVFSEIDSSTLDHTNINIEVGDINGDNIDQVRKLYSRLVYTTSQSVNIRPGDIFKDNGSYYLNVRPECDTISANVNDPKIYLLKGDPVEATSDKIDFDAKFGFVIAKENQIIMHFLDGNETVLFDKRKLSIKKKTQLATHVKVCRVVSPFIDKIRHSFTSYIGRTGVPRYPDEIVASIFNEMDEGASD